MSTTEQAPVGLGPSGERDVFEHAFEALLGRYPHAVVAAVGDDGLFVPMPESVPLTEHHVSHARSALDLVDPADRVAVITTWERAKSEGGANVAVRLAGGHQGMLHLTDLRERYGVFMVLVAAAPGAGELANLAAIPAPPPRLIRARKDGLAVLLDIEPEVSALLGWAPEQMVGHRSLDFIHPDDHDRAIDTWLDVLASRGATARARLRHLHRDGHWVWMEIANRNLLDEEPGFVDSEMFDISEEMEAVEALRASEQLMRRLAAALPVGVAQLEADGSLLYANERLFEIFGAPVGAVASTLAGCLDDLPSVRAAIAKVLTGRDVDLEVRIDPLDGSGRRHGAVSLRALTDTDGSVTGAVGCLTDTTQSVHLRDELERRATFDSLTGCLNRSTALASLEDALRGVSDVGIVFVDLDGFKAINDEHGHAVGDELLVRTARRLRGAVRGHDVVGRVGGDEFLVICPRVGDAAAATALGERIAADLSEPVVLDGGLVATRASVGVVWTGDPGHTPARDLIARADAAMYTSKAEGEGRARLAP